MFISYGAMNHILPFLAVIEVILFQAVSKFMYVRGVQRIHRRFVMRTKYQYFLLDKNMFVFDSLQNKIMDPVAIDAKILEFIRLSDMCFTI